MKPHRLFLAYFSLFVLALIWNGILHLVLLADLDATVRHLYRPDLSEHMARPLVLTAGVVGVFLWGYVRFVPTPSVREGALYGVYFAVVAGLLVDFNQYILYPIPGHVAAAWFFGGLAEFTIYGVVLSWLVPARSRHAATSKENQVAKHGVTADCHAPVGRYKLRESRMTQQTAKMSPQMYARICGVLYLYIIVAGIFAELFVRSRLVVPANATATASNIMANESLFRIGFSGELLHLAFDVVVAVILYALLRPVDRHIALLAAFMRFAADIILAVASLSHFAALRLFADPDYLKTFSADQLHTLALLALELHGDGYAICLLFFGFACLSLGYLIFRSGFLPKTIGALMAIAGVCYLINSISHFLSPAFAATLFPGLFVPMFVAELSLALWLLVKGVDAAKWEEKVSQEPIAR